MFLKTAVLFGLLALVWGQSTPVNQCIYHNAPLPINSYIENCESPPCQLPQLENVVIHLTFRAPHTIRVLRTLATAYIFGPIGINYDLGPESYTCNFLTNTYCPVLGDEVVQYTLRMFIESWFPVGTQVTVEFRVVDDSNSPLLCIRVPIAITSALPTGLEARNTTLVINADGN